MEIWPGRPFPLGATAGPDGTNFAVSSSIADAVTLFHSQQEDAKP